MPEYRVEYVVTQYRFARVEANTLQEASQKIKEYHEQENSDKMLESVLVVNVDEDE
jgi:hypothetical protein